MTALLVCMLLVGFCLCGLSGTAQSDRSAGHTYLELADAILAWEQTRLNVPRQQPLLEETILAAAGTTAGDWLPFALSRLGKPDAYDAYLTALQRHVETRYQSSNGLSTTRATEWHRIALAVLAAGGEPTAFGTDANGNTIDLIADGTYNRNLIGKQGLNSWIWGLLALDSLRYEVPANAVISREDMVQAILQSQLTDGGFALSGDRADPDMTAMALQALAPYVAQNDAVRQATDLALGCLSHLQADTGDFSSWGTPNAGSTAQVIIALCCLDIDPMQDERFCKNGRTLLDVLLQYRLEDGSFAQTLQPETGRPADANPLTTEQVLCALTALWRQANGMRTLYDLRPETDLPVPEDSRPEESRPPQSQPISSTAGSSSQLQESTTPHSSRIAVLCIGGTLLAGAGIAWLCFRKRRS